MKVFMNFFWLFVLIAMFFAGCRSLPNKTNPSFSELSENDSVEIEAIGRKAGEELLKALKERNFILFSANLTSEVKNKFTEKDFDSFIQTHVDVAGQQNEAIYFGFLRYSPIVRNYIWKVEFSKMTGKDNQQKLVTYDKLFHVYVGKVNEKYQVIGFGF